MGDQANGVIALSQWISSDAHFGQAKDADAWKRDHVAALENVVQYVNLSRGGRGTASPSSTSSPSVSGISGNVSNRGRHAQGSSHRRPRGSGEAGTSNDGVASSSVNGSIGVLCFAGCLSGVRAEHVDHCLHDYRRPLTWNRQCVPSSAMSTQRL